MTDAKIKAIAPWFGSKRSLAPEIIRELGPHSAYWELFCGGLSIIVQKPVASHEHVNDLHGDVINLARIIKDPVEGPRLYRRLRRTLFCESFHAESKAALKGELSPADRAYHYFVMSWMGRNGVSGTCGGNQTFARRFTPHGGQGGKRFMSAVDSIPAFVHRLRNVSIEQADALALVAKIDDDPAVAIYADPPYLVKGTKYTHDFTPADHVRLAELLARFTRARVVVSYYDHPDLKRLYPKWTKRTIEVTKALVNQGMRDKGGATKATEVLLINGPSFAETNAELF